MWKIYSRFVLFFRSIISASKIYWSFAYNRLYLLLVFIFQVIIWRWSFNLFSNFNNDFFIFHYTVDFGIDLVAKPNLIFIIASLALFFSLFNIILSLILVNKKLAKIYWHLLGICSFVINFFLFLSLFSIFLINFR